MLFGILELSSQVQQKGEIIENGKFVRLWAGTLGEMKNAEGKMVYRPRTPEEMEQINALVRSSVGYDANRGDVVEVENMRFVNMMPEMVDKISGLFNKKPASPAPEEQPAAETVSPCTPSQAIPQE